MPGKPGGAPTVPVGGSLAQTLVNAVQPSRVAGGKGGFIDVSITNPTAYYMGKDLSGRSIYRLTYRINGSIRTQVMSWDGTRAYAPNFTRATATEGGIPEPAIGGVPATNAALQRAKDNALAWIASNSVKIAATDATGMSRWIRDFQGDPQDFNRRWVFMRNNLPALTGVGVADFSGFGDFSIPGGGGGGFTGPQYRAPDRRVVEDFVKGTLVSLVGTIPESQLTRLTDIYMQDHRKNFDSLDKEIDPAMSVVAAIRRSADYKTIHKLRPKGVDERDWISQQRQLGERGGLETGLDQFAINQATVAGSAQDVERAGTMQQFQKSGQMPSILDNQFREIASAVFSKVAR